MKRFVVALLYVISITLCLFSVCIIFICVRAGGCKVAPGLMVGGPSLTIGLLSGWIGRSIHKRMPREA